MPANRINAEWVSYSRQVLPRDAPAVQRIETRRAFYAGAAAMHAILRALGEDDVSEDDGVDVIEETLRELKAFSQAAREGKA
jgi:hypothetical protein